MTTLAEVQALARLVPIFPCRAVADGKRKTKSPLTANGFLDASQDVGQVAAWYDAHPGCLWGVPMGSRTHLVAIDYDPDKATVETQAWVEAHVGDLMAARQHTTARNGRHYIFHAGNGTLYHTGADVMLDGCKRPGLDIRAEGGYIIWWPLAGLHWQNKAPELPAGLIDDRAFRAPAQPRAPVPASPGEWSRSRARVADALAHIDPQPYDTWIRTGMAIHHASGGSDDGFDLWHGWSSGGVTGDMPHSYSGIEACRDKWDSFGRNRSASLSLGSLFNDAKAGGYAPALRDDLPPIEAYADGNDPRGSLVDQSNFFTEETEKDDYRRPMKWADLQGKTPPQRKWIINHWLTQGPTLLAGQGGIGKTLLAQTLATAIALGRPYIDVIAEPQTVLFWACEDDHDELWRRQLAICSMFEASLDELEGKLIIEPRLGLSNGLMVPTYGAPTWTPLRDELKSQVNDYGASVLMVDNIGQCFGGNENDRHHVTAFLSGLVGLSEDHLAVLLLGHPAKSLNSEYSGSTAWEAAVRMRWYLGLRLPDQKPTEDEAEPDATIRYLCKRKANYSQLDYRMLQYNNGVYECASPEPAHSFRDRYAGTAQKETAERLVLEALRDFTKQGIRVTEGSRSPDYFARRMKRAAMSQDFTSNDLDQALLRLRMAGKVGEAPVGQYANRHQKIGLVPL